jgi:hypothetical protein
MAQTLLPTSLVGSYPQPEWLLDRAKLAGRFPPRVRLADNDAMVEQFLDEARLGLKLQHPNLVTFYDFDRAYRGAAFDPTTPVNRDSSRDDTYKGFELTLTHWFYRAQTRHLKVRPF